MNPTIKKNLLDYLADWYKNEDDEQALSSVKAAYEAGWMDAMAVEGYELRNEIYSRAMAQSYMKRVLVDAHCPEQCDVDECPICGIIMCPFDCEEHFWKDGCPCCYGSDVEPIKATTCADGEIVLNMCGCDVIVRADVNVPRQTMGYAICLPTDWIYK